MDITYSILICTYNPDLRLLSRCLKAVKHLKNDGITYEVILVDNNSKPALADLVEIRAQVAEIPGFRVIREERAGLVHARTAGIQQAQGNFIVFFDDDNEPEERYLEQLTILRQQYPHVGAWGPGKVQVDFVDGIDETLKSAATKLFQQRDDQFLAYAHQRTWQPCYPFGTGLCVKKEHAVKYTELIQAGRLTLTGRSGVTLASGDDTQLVLCVILANEAAGVSPTLRIVHMIPKKRTSFSYLKKLIAGTLMTYETSIKQMFPEYLVNGGNVPEQGFALSFKIYRKLLKAKISAKPGKMLRLVEYVSVLSGHYLALGKPAPSVLNRFLKQNVN